MTQPQTTNTYTRRIIDFSTLQPHELRKLSATWEKDARNQESKLERYMQFSNESDPVQLAHLWKVANKLWIRLRILENWRIAHPK
jgi:hypothetical protein